MAEPLDRHAIRERHFKGIEMHKTCDPQVCSRAAIGALVDELDRLHTWDGLMSLVDEHYPPGLFPVEADRDDRDPGPRILSLLRHLAAAREAVVLKPGEWVVHTATPEEEARNVW